MMDNNTSAGGKRPSIRDLQIDRLKNDAMRARRMPPMQRNKHKKIQGRLKLWLLAGFLFVTIFILSLPVIFANATIRVTPHVTKAIFNDAIFTAALVESDTGLADTDGLLRYSTVEWAATDSTILEPTGREQVEKKASGVLTIYNNYTTKKQRLIKNTRFQTSDGRVYRIRGSVVVPGKTSDGPGTLDVTVYADESGEKYNLDSGDLTLPGLKSLPDMYSTIYAKVKTPIAGGFKGERAIVSEDIKRAAIKELRAKLRERIMSEIDSRIPSDTIYFDSGVQIEFADTQESEVDGKVQLTETANVSVITFDKKEFANIISSGIDRNPPKGFPVIKDIDLLNIVIDSNNDGEEEATNIIKLVVNGDADFVWMFDTDALKRDLAGKQKEALKTILAGYPMISNAKAIVVPFWRKKFPSNIEDITIEILDTE